MNVGVFTIASKNYLAYARTLMASVKQHHPEYRRYLCLADKVDGYFAPLEENFEVIQADSLGIDTFQDMTIRYDIMEFNTAVKPFMIEWLFKNTDLDAVIYLDPDIQVFSRFVLLESELMNGASVVLTPHITRPEEDGLNPNDYHMLQAGVFNLGFIALRRCDEAIRFVQWWGRRLKTQCAADVSKNLFTDQRWCDLAPCFLDHLKVLKNPGFNVAYWNLAQRKITCNEAGNWLADNNPLVFFHFSGVNADQRTLVSKHQNRFNWKDIPSCQSLFENYLNSLVKSGWRSCKHWPYAYSCVGGSFRIPSVVRQLFREKEPQPKSFESSDAPLSLYLTNLCNEPAQNIPQHPDVTITSLMFFVYRSRPDLQAVFNLSSADGQLGFAHWFEISGIREYDLPNEVALQKLIRAAEEEGAQKKTVVFAVQAFNVSADLSRRIGNCFPRPLREKGKTVLRRLEKSLYRRI